jgi:hypothetical protein
MKVAVFFLVYFNPQMSKRNRKRINEKSILQEIKDD